MNVHGRGAAVSIDGKSLAAYATSFTFTRTADAIDSTPLGARSKVYLPGMADGTAKLEGIYDNATTTGPAALLRPLIGAGLVTLNYRAEGAGLDKSQATVAALVTSYEESVPVADMITWKCDLQLSGAIDDTAQPPAPGVDGYGVIGYGAIGYGL